MTDNRTTILVLHPSSLDPRDFLERLAGPSSSPSAGTTCSNGLEYSSIVPWDIDNKYYTASVAFCAVPQELYSEERDAPAPDEGFEVVMYLFEGKIASIPPALVRVMVEPRDIALAIRLRRNSGDLSESDPSAEAELEDLFDEIGMEYLDETEPTEDDDERPIPIAERIRQTLMTHMWPNMVRKPLASSSRGIDEYLDLDPNIIVQEDDELGEPSTAVFPIQFDPSTAGTTTVQGEAIPGIEEQSFPGADELRSQIMLQQLGLAGGENRNIEGFSRLDMLDHDENEDEDEFLNIESGPPDDWVQAEYSRLDDWLEEGEAGEDEQVPQCQDDADPPDFVNDVEDRQVVNEEDTRSGAKMEESQFEDDFADFAPFQSAPPNTAKAGPIPGREARDGGGSIPLDPTPLLLHLQHVREELAGMEEDVRRERAGREVESLFRSLGLGGLDDMEGLLDEDADEDGVENAEGERLDQLLREER